jgi:hypothetical protein
MASTGLPNNAPDDIEYHFNSINQNSCSSASGAERYSSSDDIFSGTTRSDRIPRDECGGDS